MNLGENIYKFRTNANMSQTDFANALEVSRQSASKRENNSAVPDLERLINMSKLFDVTLDELVDGKKDESKHEVFQDSNPYPQITLNFKPRTFAGALMLIFGMVFVLLSLFWGNHLWFGEEIGELVGLMISLVGLFLLATYEFKVFAISATIFVIYSTFCYGFLQVTSIASYVFTICASLVFMTWFFAWGNYATKGYEWKSIYAESENENV
jgi:transcriptional regulator with XRE-family HTH domain